MMGLQQRFNILNIILFQYALELQQIALYSEYAALNHADVHLFV